MNKAMMDSTKIEAMFNQVLRLTREGKVDWQATADAAVFVAAIGGEFTMRLQKEDFGGPSEIWFTLRDSMDRELVSLTASYDASVRTRLIELYNFARSSALRVNERVDEVLAVLGRLA